MSNCLIRNNLKIKHTLYAENNLVTNVYFVSIHFWLLDEKNAYVNQTYIKKLVL